MRSDLPLSVLGLLCPVAIGQPPPAWATLPVPAGVVAANAASIGKLCSYRDGSTLHVYSAFTRRWHATAFGPGASLRLTNECALIQDANVWTAFASHRGVFAPLPVSPQAQLVNPSGRDNDSVLLVRDGALLHAFSGFTGHWVARPVSAGAFAAVQRHSALVADGTLLGGFDPFAGQWHDLVVNVPVTGLSCDGTAGIATSATECHGFSTVLGTWSSAAFPAGASLSRADDWVLLHDQNQMLGFSGLRGAFASFPLGASVIARQQDLFVVAETAQGYVAWSAVTATFRPGLGPTTARVVTDSSLALLADGVQVTGYSPLLDVASTILLNSSGETAAGAVGTALDATTQVPAMFSSMTGQWHAAPPAALPGQPLLTTTAALLPTAGGVLAFSARNGAFVPLVAAELSLSGAGSSAPAAAWNATHLFAFDARGNRWLAEPRTGAGPVSMAIWRTSLHAIDGGVVHGFGAQGGAWTSAPVPGPVTGGRAGAESMRVDTANHVLAGTPLAELVSLWQFPEFRRVFPAGAALRLMLPMQAGDVAFLGGGPLAAAPVAIPGLGDLLIDAAWLTARLLLPEPGELRGSIELPVPPAAALRNTEWAFQALVLPAAGAPWLSGAATIRVL